MEVLLQAAVASKASKRDQKVAMMATVSKASNGDKLQSFSYKNRLYLFVSILRNCRDTKMSHDLFAVPESILKQRDLRFQWPLVTLTFNFELPNLRIKFL